MTEFGCGKDHRLRICIETPAPKGSTLGNRITALRWARILRTLGCHVQIGCDDRTRHTRFDCLIGLHACRSANVIRSWKERVPDKPALVCVTGTDLHRDLAKTKTDMDYQKAAETLRLVDHVVLLEPNGIKSLADKKLLREVEAKSSVILQSASPVRNPPKPLKTRFEVSVIGHLRPVKDPFRAAEAAAMLPADSRVRIVHFGQALTESMRRKAIAIQTENPRYRWLGPRPHGETQRRLVRSRVMVLSSQIEGAPGVVSEAIVNHIPVLASRIPATIGLLKKGYPGFFDYGATGQLAQLIQRVEFEPKFRKTLRDYIKKLRPQFLWKAEVACWRKLIAKIS